MNSSQIRQTFLTFFEQRGHRVVRSSSLVPANDPTLLFTNAGMNQFKDVFLGREKRDYLRACSSQKCVRAGGKHNDLKQVGRTTRHHTFFEMLGNFSFGDYFKKEAIAYAWELVTSPQWFGIPKGNLYITVFGGGELIFLVELPEDEEARGFWEQQGVDRDRVIRIPGFKDSFWAMGETGPCGPCSEIHYDMGPPASDLGHGTTAPECKFPCDCGRYVEIWNLVFMQYNRYCKVERAGKRHTEGEIQAASKQGISVHEYCNCLAFEPLPKPCVDTGMGLERLAAVLQGKISNFDTDLFQPLTFLAASLCELPGTGSGNFKPTNEKIAASLRVIADHSRATTFLIADGVIPSSEGRGYVLRKIIRRAMRHARLLGGNFYVLSNMANSVVQVMAGGPSEESREKKFPYPELHDSLPHIREVIRSEEVRFEHTLEEGSKRLNS